MTDQVKEVYGVGSVNIDDYAYYYTLAKEDQSNLRNICVVDASPDYDGAFYQPDGLTALKWGVPVKSDCIPKRVQKNGPQRQVPDFFKGFGMSLVSEKFKQVVEGIEPGVHQFFPVEMVWEDGTPVVGQYYWFVVCNSIDSVSSDKTDSFREWGFKYFQQREAYGLWKIYKEGGGHYNIVFDLMAINGRHIWLDKYLSEGPYCSDRFKQACEKAGIVGIGFGKGKLEAV